MPWVDMCCAAHTETERCRRFLRRGEAVVSAPDSRVEVRVVPTNEEAMIARHTLGALGA